MSSVSSPCDSLCSTPVSTADAAPSTPPPMERETTHSHMTSGLFQALTGQGNDWSESQPHSPPLPAMTANDCPVSPPIPPISGHAPHSPPLSELPEFQKPITESDLSQPSICIPTVFEQYSWSMIKQRFEEDGIGEIKSVQLRNKSHSTNKKIAFVHFKRWNVENPYVAELRQLVLNNKSFLINCSMSTSGVRIENFSKDELYWIITKNHSKKVEVETKKKTERQQKAKRPEEKYSYAELMRMNKELKEEVERLRKVNDRQEQMLLLALKR